MKNHRVTIGLIQMAMDEGPDENLRKATARVEQAALNGATIICLPELYRSRYFPQYIGRDASRYAEPVPGVSTNEFSRIARSQGVVIVVPVFEKSSEGRYYNSAVVIDADGKFATPYRKVHIPQDPGFYEKEYFYPGDGYQIHATRFGTIAVLICYDQWYPEAARSVVLEGADIIFYPTAIGHPSDDTPGEGEWQEPWELIQRSHAIANSVHVAAVNRVGQEGKIRFFGGSFVCDAFGTVLAKAGDSDETLITTIDLSMNQTVRDSWGFLRNRRPDTYGSLCIPFPGGAISPVRPGDTPRNRGFRMPAEWEPHDAIWIAWPYREETFPNLTEVERSFAGFIAAMRGSERVELLVRDNLMASGVREILKEDGTNDSHVTFRTADYADVWIRDYGPSFVVNPALRQLAMARWRFNAWGGKYDDLLKDAEIPGFMEQWLGVPVFEPGIVLEGGSIDVNGRGTVLTTRACLLNRNRNPSLSESDIEEYLREYLGATTVIWLREGITGDDTDGHVDDIARFAGPSTIVCAYEEDRSDPNFGILHENYEILKSARDQDDSPLAIVKLPMPGPVTDENERYPASYTNFYIGNTVVVVPTFNDPNDAKAIRILQGLFPDRRVIGIPARAMVEGFGTFHCASQQQPLV